MHARELHAANIGCSEVALPAGLFGKRWRAGWRKRMEKLGFPTALRSVQDSSAARVARLTPQMVDEMFPSWERVLQTGNNGGVFAPENVYIMDEVGVGGKLRQQRAVVLKGAKGVQRVGSNRVEGFTYVVCFNVLGHMLPPFFLFHRENGVPGDVMRACGSKAYAMAKVKSCMMNQESFEIFVAAFAKHTGATRDNKVLLKLDGHSSRDCDAVIKKARELGVEIWQLPGQVTSKACEVDTHFGRPFKLQLTIAYSRESNRNPGRAQLPLHVYVRMCIDAQDKVAASKAVCNAFRDTGFYPPDKQQMLSRLPKKNATDEARASAEAREAARTLALTLAHRRPRAEVEQPEEDPASKPAKKRRHDKPIWLTGDEHAAEVAEWAAAPEGQAAARKAVAAAARKALAAETLANIAAGAALGDAPQAKPGAKEVRCCRICGLTGHRADNKKVHPQGAQTPATQTAPEAV